MLNAILITIGTLVLITKAIYKHRDNKVPPADTKHEVYLSFMKGEVK